MSYTPPDWDAVNFTWEGESTYTAPDWDAADFSFAAGGVTASLRGVGVLGAPQLLASEPPVAWLQGPGILGAPQLLAEWPPNEVYLQAPGLIGVPRAQAHTAFKAWLEGAGVIGVPQSLARIPTSTFSQLRGAGVLGAPQLRAFGYPASAATLTPGIVRYYCKLTGTDDGLEDAILPISNFTVRHRNEAPSYYAVTIPSYAYVGDLTARPHGEIVIWSEQSGVSEELMRGALGQVAVYRGANSQSITIQGNSERATTPPLTYRLDAVTYLNTTFGGESRLRIDPRAAIRPGDYVRYQEVGFTVGDIAWSVSVSAGGLAATMELASLPLEA